MGLVSFGTAGSQFSAAAAAAAAGVKVCWARMGTGAALAGRQGIGPRQDHEFVDSSGSQDTGDGDVVGAVFDGGGGVGYLLGRTLHRTWWGRCVHVDPASPMQWTVVW